MQVTMYGASDNLIKVDGDELREEFDVGDGPRLLLCSDGTRVRVEYADPGIWRVEPIDLAAGCTIGEHYRETDPESDGYSDRLTLTGDFTWVECWQGDGPVLEALEEWFETHEFVDWPGFIGFSDLLKMYRLAMGHQGGVA